MVSASGQDPGTGFAVAQGFNAALSMGLSSHANNDSIAVDGNRRISKNEFCQLP
jgi:hypothetical protein